MKFSITLLKDFVLETRLEVNYIWFLFMKDGGVWVGGCGVGGDEAEREEEVDGLQSDHGRDDHNCFHVFTSYYNKGP